MGTALGASIELSINVSNVCLSTVATALQSIYLMFYYMTSYLTTNDDEYVAYAVSYTIKLFRTGLKIDTCLSYIQNIVGEPMPMTVGD